MSNSIRVLLGVCISTTLAAAVAGCRMGATTPAPSVEPAAQPAPVPLARDSVAMPRAYVAAVEALTAAHRQRGLRYAVLTPQFVGVVGPFEVGQRVAMRTLLEQVAAATGTRLTEVAGAAVFEGPTPPSTTDAAIDSLLDRLANAPAVETAAAATTVVTAASVADAPGGLPAGSDPQAVYELGDLFQARCVVPLSRLAASSNGRVARAALDRLAAAEGGTDYETREWPGRVSIFELLADQIDAQSLMWALEDAGPVGGRSWKQAMSVLGRARYRLLNRHAWRLAYSKDRGALHLAYWAIGRVDDPSAAFSVRSKIGTEFTNEPADRYLAAMAAARHAPDRLGLFIKSDDPEQRRAAAFGAGFVPRLADAGSVVEAALADPEPSVRAIACESAARLALRSAAPSASPWMQRLARLVVDGNLPDGDRAAAVAALAEVPGAAVDEALKLAANDRAAGVRSAYARALGDRGGSSARRELTDLLRDADRWVQAEALCSLGRLGDAESVSVVCDALLRPQSDLDTRIAAAIGLGRGRSPASADALARVAADPKAPDRVRDYAVRALAQLAGRAGQGALARLAALNAPAHNALAVRYLALDTPAATAAALIPLLTAGDRVDSAAAANRLAELGYGPGVRELLEGSDVFDNSARMMHSWGAIRSRGPSANAALIEAAASRRNIIRRQAALALGGRGEPRAVNTLLALCADRQPQVRVYAAQSLGVTGDPAAIPVLIDLATRDTNKRVSSAAIRALRRGDWADRPEVVAAFVALAGSDRDCGVINPAAPSLKDQPDHSFVLRRWPMDVDDLSITDITYESSLTYDSDRGRVVQWGSHGRRADFPQTGQTWFYDAGTNQWKRLVRSAQWPNGTCLNWGTTYDPANEVVVSPKSGHGGHGWVNALRANLSQSVPWVMDATTDQWHAARPLGGPGGNGLGQIPGVFDTERDVVIFWHGPLWAYDAYANRWTKLAPTGPAPEYGGSAGWDPVTGRLIGLCVAPGDRFGALQTWAYDPAANKWQDLQADGGPPALRSRLMYDSANDVMIGFAHAADKALQVYVYHLRENRWEKMPMVYPTPRFGTLDCTYDSRHNAVVFSGGWETGASGEVTQRETWTYRYRRASGPARLPGRIREIRLNCGPDGQATITWGPWAGAGQYRVLRGVGPSPWQATLSPIATVSGDEVTYTQKRLEGAGGLYWYRVEALDGQGKVLARSRLVRTAPAAVPAAWAAVVGNKVKVGWTPPPGNDLIGYRVYRAVVDVGNPWKSNGAIDLAALADKLTPVSGEQPIPSAPFIDEQAPTPAEGGNEAAWPKTCLYVVRAVNAWGREGGASPATLAIPAVPGPVCVVPWADGRRLVVWTPPPGDGLAGFHLMRMDDWRHEAVFRCNGAPLAAVGLADDEDFPTADRRRYYVVGVDEQGTLGVPSSGAWSHGLP